MISEKTRYQHQPRNPRAPASLSSAVVLPASLRHRLSDELDAEIILIDQRNHHIFQPLLYQVATAVLSPAEIAAPIRQLEAKQRNLTVVLAEVTKVDLNSRTVDATCSGVGALKFPFDYLVVATGMRPSYFGHDDFAQYAPGLKNLNDAETVRAKILSAFELAEETDDASERLRQMTFVLVGGGATGVELAASMAHMITVTFRGNFRQIDPAKSKIILLEGGDRILPTFAETLSKKATKRLEKLGISVRTGVKVEKVDGEGVIAGGQRIAIRNGAMDSRCCSITDRKDAWCQDRPCRPSYRRSVLECPKYSGRLRRRRRCLSRTKGTTGARGRAGGHPARALCGPNDRTANQRTAYEAGI